MAVVVQTGGGSGSTSPVTATWNTAPTKGNKLLAVINSATTVTTPAGWTARVSLVNSQGFYVYEKTAGTAESTTLALTTTGNFPASVTLVELDATQVGPFDVVSPDSEAPGVQASRTIATVTTTGTNGSFVLGVVAGHGGVGDASTAVPTWTNSFTALRTSTAAAPNTGDEVGHLIATRAMGTAGAVGATTANWSVGSNASFTNTYGIHVAYQGVSPSGTVAAPPATATATARPPSVAPGNGTVAAPTAVAAASAAAPGLDIITKVVGGGPAAAVATIPAPIVVATGAVTAVRAAATARARRPLVTTNLTVGPAFVAPDGSKAILLGWWDGTDIQPVNISGYWDTGTTHSL